VSDAEYKRLLRMPPTTPWSDALLERALWARQWTATHARPWLFARSVAVQVTDERRFSIDEEWFHSRVVEKRIRKADEALVVVVSAGPEIMQEAGRLWAAGEPDRYFFLECFAAATVEALLSEARARLCAWAADRGDALLPHHSPGYPGWDVSEQPALLRAATRGGAIVLPGPLEILSSGMPRPRASQLAIFGVTHASDPAAVRGDDVPCRHCAWMRCELRREPFQPATSAAS
jgi:hypothetical protein